MKLILCSSFQDSVLLHSTHAMVVPSHFVAADRIQRTDVFVLRFTALEQLKLQFVKAGRCYLFHRTFLSLEGSQTGSGASSRLIRYLGALQVICSTNKVSLEREGETPKSICPSVLDALKISPQTMGKRFIYRMTTLRHIHGF